jgi:hypothetical protein
MLNDILCAALGDAGTVYRDAMCRGPHKVFAGRDSSTLHEEMKAMRQRLANRVGHQVLPVADRQPPISHDATWPLIWCCRRGGTATAASSQSVFRQGLLL